jgi:gliding motility-associated-like protein
MTHLIRTQRLSTFLCIKKLLLLLLCLVASNALLAQLQVQIVTQESRCSANGRITVNVTGGTPPYNYVLVGTVRPPQNTNIFDLLPPANYTVRVTDNAGISQTINTIVTGNYQEPTITQCIVNNDTVQVIGNQGRLPYRYAISSNGGQTYSVPQTSNTFTCLRGGAHIVRIYDSCANFYSTSVSINIPALRYITLCEMVNGKTNLTTSSFGGGIPPYTFTCINNFGDTFRNATGNFPQMRGCGFRFTFADKCEQRQELFNCTDLKGYVRCATFATQTATVYAQGGIPPYHYTSLNTLDSNTTGIFNNLPTTLNTYTFTVRDACHQVRTISVNKMDSLPNQANLCPFRGNLLATVNQIVDLPDTCGRGCSLFYPYQFNCLDCVPARTLSDIGTPSFRTTTFQTDFTPQPAGTYHFQVVNGCRDTVRFALEVKPDKTPLNITFNCLTNKIHATSLDSVTFFLKDSMGRLLATNRTGIFNSPYTGLAYVQAIYPGCDTITKPIETKIPVNNYCLAMSAPLNPITGLCNFKWVLQTLSPSTTYRIRGINDSINITNTTGVFPNLAPSSVYLLSTDCRTDTVHTLPDNTPTLRVELVVNCTGQPTLQGFGGREALICYRYIDKYVLLDEQGTVLKSNYSGLFDSLIIGKLYEVRLQNPEGCFIGSVKRRVTPYERPDLTASYGVICAVGQTTGNIRLTLRGGVPPYIYEMISPVGLRTAIITVSNSTIYDNLPAGNYVFRASDACGVSSDFATSVGTLQVTPSYKRRCDGTLILEMPIIDSATYQWTNAGRILGNSRILEIRDTTAQTYSVQITTPQPCTYTNSIVVPRFTPINIVANAGIDFVSTTLTTNLHAQSLQPNTTGRWRAISPSAGTTTFSNPNDPNTIISISRTPGDYLYVWEVTDATGGCTMADTVRGIFCTTISPLNVTIAVTPSACKTPTGKAVITVRNAVAPVTYRWSNGRTTATIDSLSAGIYIVTIHDGLPCTPIRVDTVAIINPNGVLPRRIDTTVCDVSALRIGNKTYIQSGRYQDTVRNIYGCDSLIVNNIRFSRVPIDSLGMVHQLKGKYCGDSISLNSKGDVANKYHWFWQNVPCPTCPNPSIVPLGNRAYVVMITDRITKCIGRDTVNVTVEGALTQRIPNVFTPNGDHLNDIFNVLPDNCIKTVRRLRIYSRSGNLVFDKTDVSPHRGEGWGGLMSNNDPTHSLPSDVYVFMMEIELIDGIVKEVSGEITLLH